MFIAPHQATPPVVVPPPPPPPSPQISPTCQPIVDHIKQLKSDLQEMQNELNTPPFPTAGQRAAIVNSIKRINNQIAEKQKELHLCVQQCSGKPSIFFFCNFYRACTIGIV
jgi:hypothetical protein